MRSFFSMEGPLFEGLSRAADLIILNILFLLCCIPVLTIGASLTGLSYVTLKMKEGKEGYVWKSFFRGFKNNFRQATLIWLVMLVFAAVLGVDVLLLRQASIGGGLFRRVMGGMVIAGGVLWALILLYVFPLQARFYNSVWNTFRNALFLSLANAPKSLLMLLVTAGAVILTIWNTSTFVWGLFLWMTIAFALLSYLNSSLQIRLFHTLAGETDEETEETGTGEEFPAPENGTGEEEPVTENEMKPEIPDLKDQIGDSQEEDK